VDASRHLDLIDGRRRGAKAALQRLALRMASWPYAAAMALRNFAYDRNWFNVHRARVPVVSVGNLTVGGTGKTPCIEYLAKWFRAHEVCVAILSRGYGESGRRNDEALLLEENLPDVPHLQGSDRAALAQTAIEELESEVLLLDDGFQHRRLARDIDLVLIDATNPWGFGALLPRGLMREPPRSLRRATAAIVTRCDQAAFEQIDAIEKRMQRIAPGMPVLRSEHRATAWQQRGEDELAPGALAGKKAIGFCGIGNAGAFRRSVEALGLEIAGWKEFPDHHRYQRGDVEDLQDWSANADCDVVVTTQKDRVKLQLGELAGRPLYALRIEFQITKGEETLHEILKRCLLH